MNAAWLGMSLAFALGAAGVAVIKAYSQSSVEVWTIPNGGLTTAGAAFTGAVASALAVALTATAARKAARRRRPAALHEGQTHGE